MARLGKLLERLRIAKGLSAKKLSETAGLSINYVRNIERSVRRPQPAQLMALARALEVDAATLAEIRRLAGIDEDLIPSPLPGAVLWKHLPALLFSIPHDAPPAHRADPDQQLSDVVHACGSLLGWISLMQRPVSTAERNAISAEVQAAVEEGATQGSNGPAQRPCFTALLLLPHLWREQRLAREKDTRKLAGEIEHWRYGYFPPGIDEPSLTVRFKSSELDEQWGAVAQPNDISNLHAGMLAHRLWADLSLDDLYADDFALSSGPHLNRCGHLADDVVRVMTTTTEDFLQGVPLPQRSRSDRLRKMHGLTTLLLRARFASRAFDDERIALLFLAARAVCSPDLIADFYVAQQAGHAAAVRQVTPPGGIYSRKQVLARVAELQAALFSEEPPKSS